MSKDKRSDLVGDLKVRVSQIGYAISSSSSNKDRVEFLVELVDVLKKVLEYLEIDEDADFNHELELEYLQGQSVGLEKAAREVMKEATLYFQSQSGYENTMKASLLRNISHRLSESAKRLRDEIANLFKEEIDKDEKEGDK